MKTLEQHFIDWESHVFGFGYGTGEWHVIPALHRFLELCQEGGGRCYHYDKLEEELGSSTAWLLINALCHADVIEYGSSPRFGFLTREGEALRKFVLSRAVNDLIECVTESAEDHEYASPTHWDDENGANPFWQSRRAAK